MFRDIIQSLRPNQWTKNAVVLAALFFAFGDRSQHPQILAGMARVLPAALIFCLASSGIYLLNDILDIESDRHHPRKRCRPIAAGRISLTVALRLGLGLLFISALLAWMLSWQFAVVLGSYIALQTAYSLFLKHVPLVDVLLIATGFVIRAIAGAVTLNVPISPWLLLCAFLLALFLALCKRRHEKVLLTGETGDTRPSLEDYDERLLDQLISIVAGATIVCYAIYTLSQQTIDKFGTARLGFTIPFVIFGIFRYLDLVYRHEKGDRPEKILLTDVPILADLALYGATVIAVFVLPR